MRLTDVKPVTTGKISDNLYAAKTGTVNFFVLSTNNGNICIDSGFGRKLIARELDLLGIDPASITHLFLTHSDFDHANGLAIFKMAEIFLSSGEEQMINGQTARMAGIIHNSKIKRAHHLLNDGDVVAVGSTTVKAISSPGHTPGSMSYLVNESILFVGDAFKLVNNKVFPKRHFYNMDSRQHKESIRKLAHLDNIRLVCTAHNGYTKEFSEAIGDWK